MNFTILVEGSMLFLTHVPSLYLDCMLDVYVGIEMKIIKKMECFHCMVTIIKPFPNTKTPWFIGNEFTNLEVSFVLNIYIRTHRFAIRYTAFKVESSVSDRKPVDVMPKKKYLKHTKL